MQAANDAHEYSNTVDLIGTVIMIVSIGLSVLAIIFFGKVDFQYEVSTVYFSKKEWSPILVGSFAIAGISGTILGYIFKVLAKILNKLESLQK